MSITGYSGELAAIAALFYTGWASATPIAWENLPFKTKEYDTKWVEFFIVNGSAGQISIGDPGNNVYRHIGVVMINIYVKPDLGKKEALTLADSIVAIFRAASIDDIFFKAATVTTLGLMGSHFQVNVSIPFDRDSLM